jgi:hypothetical protein
MMLVERLRRGAALIIARKKKWMVVVNYPVPLLYLATLKLLKALNLLGNLLRHNHSPELETLYDPDRQLAASGPEYVKQHEPNW